MTLTRRKPTVSATCEVLVGNGHCGAVATHAYPAMGGGYMSLCTTHAPAHLRICVTIEAARRGEVPNLDEGRANA